VGKDATALDSQQIVELCLFDLHLQIGVCLILNRWNRAVLLSVTSSVWRKCSRFGLAGDKPPDLSDLNLILCT
jgi:hypothetical protein